MTDKEYRAHIESVCKSVGGFEGNGHRISRVEDNDDNIYWLVEEVGEEYPSFGCGRDVGMFEDLQVALNIFIDVEPNSYN